MVSAFLSSDSWKFLIDMYDGFVVAVLIRGVSLVRVLNWAVMASRMTLSDMVVGYVNLRYCVGCAVL